MAASKAPEVMILRDAWYHQKPWFRASTPAKHPEVMILRDTWYHQKPWFRASTPAKHPEVMILRDAWYHQNPGIWIGAVKEQPFLVACFFMGGMVQ